MKTNNINSELSKALHAHSGSLYRARRYQSSAQLRAERLTPGEQARLQFAGMIRNSYPAHSIALMRSVR